MNPDIYIRIKIRTTIEGGRKTPIMGDFYGCPLIVDNEAYDCRLLINNMKLELGHIYEVPVKFLNKSLVWSHLTIGKTVVLWEGKEIADGEVTKICDDL